MSGSGNKPVVIAALDVEERKPALDLVDKLRGTIDYFKVGSRLFTALGPGFIEEIIGMGGRVFLDLKFHDIPATVAGSVRAACGLGVSMMTIHTTGGFAMMRAAAEGAEEASVRAGAERPLIVGVTVLTSMTSGDFDAIAKVEDEVGDIVMRLAARAKEAGLDGIVSSANEAARIRREFGEDFVIVTPGIRPAGSASDDQKRVATPRMAAEAGSDFLVVGRPIYKAESPREAAEAIIGELEGI